MPERETDPKVRLAWIEEDLGLHYDVSAKDILWLISRIRELEKDVETHRREYFLRYP